MKLQYLRGLAAALVLPALVSAQENGDPAQSDWLELVKGHRGETLGTEVREIDSESSDDYHEVTLAIPKKSVRHPDEIEEVVVVGRAPEKPEPLDVEYHWLDDYEDDHYGLVIRLGKDSQWPIRLFMSSQEGYIRQLPEDIRMQEE